MFGYLLLEELGIGPPEVLFLSSRTGTGITILVVTEEIQGWVDSKKLLNAQEVSQETQKLFDQCVEEEVLKKLINEAYLSMQLLVELNLPHTFSETKVIVNRATRTLTIVNEGCSPKSMGLKKRTSGHVLDS
uniref:Uncharacterized protein n=1 Tax=Ditylenchus dipsaci TaxID=166011 RepID=A0A915EJ10_9BILA